jgi:hypothetical protein
MNLPRDEGEMLEWVPTPVSGNARRNGEFLRGPVFPDGGRRGFRCSPALAMHRSVIVKWRVAQYLLPLFGYSIGNVDR